MYKKFEEAEQAEEAEVVKNIYSLPIYWHRYIKLFLEVSILSINMAKYLQTRL